MQELNAPSDARSQHRAMAPSQVPLPLSVFLAVQPVQCCGQLRLGRRQQRPGDSLRNGIWSKELSKDGSAASTSPYYIILHISADHRGVEHLQ